jgi:hypothetical protein
VKFSRVFFRSSDRSTRLNGSSQAWGLQPPMAWIVILGFAFLSVLLIAGGAGRILNLAFPAGSLVVGVFLYFRYPILYLGFTWWIWFLTPLVRRLADWKSGFTDPSPILLAPYLVTFVMLVTLWKHLPKMLRQGGLPFVLPAIGIFYSFCIGLVYRSPVQVGIALLDWLAPILLGFHLFVNWQNYPSYRQNLQRVFLWGVLVMGVYGVIQFLVLPDWDRLWLIQSGFTTGGKPFPFRVNVWSTLNANRPFGTVMMAGLLLLTIHKKSGILGLPAIGTGYLSFFLTKKRTTWLTWLLGLLILSGSLKPKTQMRLIVTLCLTILLVIPLITLEPFSETISSRLETFTNLEEDNSKNAREEIYQAFFDQALVSFVGTGIGGQFYDSAILALLLDFGWGGMIFYMGGLLPAIVQICYYNGGRHDPFAGASRAITLSTFAQIPLGNPMIEIQGIILWGFLGMSLAARKYHREYSTFVALTLNPSPK